MSGFSLLFFSLRGLQEVDRSILRAAQGDFSCRKEEALSEQPESTGPAPPLWCVKGGKGPGKSCEKDQAGLLKPKRLKGSSYPPEATFRSPKRFERHEGRVCLLLCLLIYRQQQCRDTFHEGQQCPEFPSGPHQPRHTATHLCALWEVSWLPQQGFPAICVSSSSIRKVFWICAIILGSFLT